MFLYWDTQQRYSIFVIETNNKSEQYLLRQTTKVSQYSLLGKTTKVLNGKRAARARGDHGAQKSQGCLSAEEIQGVEAKKSEEKKPFNTPLVFTMNIRGEPPCPRRQANCIQQVILTLAHQKQKSNAVVKFEDLLSGLTRLEAAAFLVFSSSWP